VGRECPKKQKLWVNPTELWDMTQGEGELLSRRLKLLDNIQRILIIPMVVMALPVILVAMIGEKVLSFLQDWLHSKHSAEYPYLIRYNKEERKRYNQLHGYPDEEDEEDEDV
jgi:hypothetical protein